MALCNKDFEVQLILAILEHIISCEMCKVNHQVCILKQTCNYSRNQNQFYNIVETG